MVVLWHQVKPWCSPIFHCLLRPLSDLFSKLVASPAPGKLNVNELGKKVGIWEWWWSSSLADEIIIPLRLHLTVILVVIVSPFVHSSVVWLPSTTWIFFLLLIFLLLVIFHDDISLSFTFPLYICHSLSKRPQLKFSVYWHLTGH